MSISDCLDVNEERIAKQAGNTSITNVVTTVSVPIMLEYGLKNLAQSIKIYLLPHLISPKFLLLFELYSPHGF